MRGAVLRSPILLVFLAFSTALSAQSVPPRQQPGGPVTRILMLYGHDANSPGVVGFAREFHAVLRSEWPEQVEVYNESLDFDRIGDRESWPQFAAYLADKYRGFRIDAAVAEGSAALQFAMEYYGRIFPGVPIVYGLAFEPVVDFAALPAHVTGTRIPLPFVETFALARALQPDAKRVVVVAGASAMDSVLLTHAVRDLTPVLDGMRLEVLRDWTYPSLLESLRRLPDETFVILSSFRRDWGGQAFNSGDLIPSITRFAAVPVYGIARNWVGDGIVGGMTMQFASEGEHTARLLARVLRRRPGDPLPEAEVAENVALVDWRQLQRWGLSDERLPAGTRVLYRTPTTWERYRIAILTVLGVTVAQSLLIARLMLERRARIRAQRSVQEQAEFEYMMAALGTEAARHTPDEERRALERAVERIGRYSGAGSAELVVYPDLVGQPLEVVRWAREERDGAGAAGVVELPLRSGARLEGTLKLQRLPDYPRARNGSTDRLEAAADLLAAALARARSARALAESRNHVAHIGRIATMAHLAAAVSHELRQPLTAIHLHAETGLLLLGRESPDVHEAREVLRDIVSDNARALEVIEHVRMLLRKDQAASVSVSASELCRNAARLLQRDARTKGVSIDVSLSDGLPTVRGDAVQLQQVVINLALNAIESAATSAGERRVVLATAERAGRVEISVRDSGPGLSPEVQRHLFESFFSTKPGGLGMGLAIVHQILERHGGEVHAQNAPGGGALFRVTLPRETEEG